MDLSTVKKAHVLKNYIYDKTSQYYHSTILASSKGKILFDGTRQSFSIRYGLKDILLIGALTESPVLLTGGTDLGKTTLAKYMMQALFGEEEKGWHRLDFDLDFGKDAYTNVNSDFFHESGKSLKDLYSVHNWMFLPGFIADELNGAHPKILRKALHIIREKDLTLSDGRREKIGHPLVEPMTHAPVNSSDTYQYQIATINEGHEYSGTFDMDKALRRRTTIEIPMDIFMPMPEDRLSLQKAMREPVEASQNNLMDVLDIFNQIKTLKLHPIAEILISYLESFDFCNNSLTGNKSSIPTINGSIRHICTKPAKIGDENISDIGCVFLKSFENDLCPEVRGITPGISENLVLVAKGFALLRAIKFVEMVSGVNNQQSRKRLSYYVPVNPESFRESLKKYAGGEKQAITKYINNLEVEETDILSAICFVGYSKIGMSPNWVSKYYQGNKFEAVSNFCQTAYDKLVESLSMPEFDNLADVVSGKAPREHTKTIIDNLAKSNPWLLRALTPYMNQDHHNDTEYDLYDV